MISGFAGMSGCRRLARNTLSARTISIRASSARSRRCIRSAGQDCLLLCVILPSPLANFTSGNHLPPFAFSPSSTSRRMASERAGVSACLAAQLATAARNSSDSLIAVTGSRPVAGRPPLLGFGSTDLDFDMFWYYHASRPRGRADFRLGSNPSHQDAFSWPPHRRRRSGTGDNSARAQVGVLTAPGLSATGEVVPWPWPQGVAADRIITTHFRKDARRVRT